MLEFVADEGEGKKREPQQNMLIMRHLSHFAEARFAQVSTVGRSKGKRFCARLLQSKDLRRGVLSRGQFS